MEEESHVHLEYESSQSLKLLPPPPTPIPPKALPPNTGGLLWHLAFAKVPFRFRSVKLPCGLLLSTLAALQRHSTVFSLCVSDNTLNLRVKIQFIQLSSFFLLLHVVFMGFGPFFSMIFMMTCGQKFSTRTGRLLSNTSSRGKLLWGVGTNVDGFF